jgi:ATP synthase assembly factor FMC1, mitochondrial
MPTPTSNTAPSLRTLYRRLLRELPPTPQPRHTLPRTPIHASIRSHLQFPQTSTASSAENARLARLQELEQFVIYLRAQRMYGTLLARYNPGMGMEEEERVRLTARRVGMDLPVEYEWKVKR